MPFAAVSASPPRAARATNRANVLSMEGAYDVAARVAAINASGRTVANLAIGEPSFATPEHILEAGVRALRDGETRYAPVAGIEVLRIAVATSARDRGHAAPDPASVVITPGAKPALFYALLALLDRGDEVLVPDPGFPAYASVAQFAEAVPVAYDALQAIDVDALAALITQRTRVLILNSPGNPSGSVLDAATLGRLAELVLRQDLAVISDECYGQLIYDGTATAPSITAFPELADRVIMIDSFSKTYAMTGWRLGYAIAPRRLVRTIHRLAVNGHSCTPTFVQRAGIAALTGTQGPLQRMRAELRGRRDVLVAALDQLPGVTCAAPGGAFYAFADCSRLGARTGRSTSQLADWLLDTHGVASVAGTAFGPRGAGHLRFSFAAAPDQIALAIERLATVLGEVAP